MEKSIRREKEYQCPICKLHYKERVWATKCKAWCSKHESCNLAITRHSLEAKNDNIEKTAIQQRDTLSHTETRDSKHEKQSSQRLLTFLFYLLIGITASIGLFLLYDFFLTRTSSITTLILNTVNDPFYLWFYSLSTFVAIILFGIDVAVSIYLFRSLHVAHLKEQGGNTVGVIIGAFAASCPVCSGLLLSLIGISGGLSVFPFKGLELKTLSVLFLAVPLFFLLRRLKSHNCEDTCSHLENAAFQTKDRVLFGSLFVFLLAEILLGYSFLRAEPILADLFYPIPKATTSATAPNAQLSQQVQQEVLPTSGFQTPIVLGKVIPEMVANGIIDVQKLQDLYKERGGIPQEEMDLLTKQSDKPLVITSKNQFWLVTFLWPLGLANKMIINNQSPLAGKDLFNFASTGGWNLGQAKNGGSYFNQYSIIPLTTEQEEHIRTLAENIYRPCCNNSTFFQDCNHGSAALALIELGVAQGLSDQEIYKTVLHFNSFWFPQNYTEMGLYFKAVKHTDWNDVDPELALSKDYSSISGWSQNVDAPIRQIPGLLPAQNGGGSCGT